MNHILKAFFDFLAEGFRPGDTLSNVRRRLKGNEQLIEKAVEGHHTFFASGLTNGSGAESKVEVFAAPYDMEITGITARRAGASADSASATLVADVGGDDANPLSASNIDIDGLTDDTTTAQTLSTTAANLLLKKGELLKCTWATDSAGTITDAAVIVHFKRLQDGQL